MKTIAQASAWVGPPARNRPVGATDKFWSQCLGNQNTKHHVVLSGFVYLVVQYVPNQEAHHKTITFQDEYRAFLKRHNIPFDERYVWD